MVKIDLGCGTKKEAGFVGCDRIKFEGVDHVFDMGRDVWPFETNSVEEARACHTVEHLSAIDRCFFYNELWRVLEVGGKCVVQVPHWANNRAYGDPTHQWPPVSEFSLYYLSKKWRAENAPHTDIEHWPLGYACDFEATWGYSLHQHLVGRNLEFQQFASNFYKEALVDMQVTITKQA